MQKQEMKSKRRSRELEGPASWREHRAMISHHDRRAARERQVTVASISPDRLFSHVLHVFVVYSSFHQLHFFPRLYVHAGPAREA